MKIATRKNSSRTAQAKIQNYGKGDCVRLKNREGIFRVNSPAGWGGRDYATATAYNLINTEGMILSAIPSDVIEPLQAEDLRKIQEAGESLFRHAPRKLPVLSSEAIIAELAERKKRERELLQARMRKSPAKTRRMGFQLLGEVITSAHDLDMLIERLTERYRVSHCWSCWGALNNFDFKICPTCGWTKCDCGGCGCNYPLNRTKRPS